MAKNTTLHYIMYTLYIHYIHYYLLSELKKFGARSCRAPNVHQTSIGGARTIVSKYRAPTLFFMVINIFYSFITS